LNPDERYPLRRKKDRGANAGPYVGNTVGLYNYRWFVLYCLSFTLAALHWEVLAYARARAGGGDMLLYVSAAWFALFVAFGLAMLAYHAQLLAANLTTNEHTNATRYSYLRDPATGAFRNPYDHGCARNVTDRLLPPHLDDHPLILETATASPAAAATSP